VAASLQRSGPLERALDGEGASGHAALVLRGVRAGAAAMRLGRRLAAIYNPTSGGGRFRRDLPLIVGSLGALGFVVEEHPTERAGQATELAARAVEDGIDVVCAIGGDGTVNEVVNGMAGSDVPLAVIPTGTVNVLAIELGIPLDPPDACRLAAQGHVIAVDLGLAGERYFALMAGCGLDAAVVSSLNPTLKKALKEAAFAIQGLAKYLTADSPLIRVETEEECIDGYYVVLGNAANYGGNFGVTPLADMRDGLLDVCVLTDKSFFEFAGYWLAALVSAPMQHSKVRYFRTEAARLTVAPGETGEVLVQTDGEPAGRLPIDCRIAPGALRVIVP
jgi:diacylglycerol kinase (ATP)